MESPFSNYIDSREQNSSIKTKPGKNHCPRRLNPLVRPADNGGSSTAYPSQTKALLRGQTKLAETQKPDELVGSCNGLTYLLAWRAMEVNSLEQEHETRARTM